MTKPIAGVAMMLLFEEGDVNSSLPNGGTPPMRRLSQQLVYQALTDPTKQPSNQSRRVTCADTASQRPFRRAQTSV